MTTATLDLVRHVRTPRGAAFFKKPIGTVITEGEYEAVRAAHSAASTTGRIFTGPLDHTHVSHHINRTAALAYARGNERGAAALKRAAKSLAPDAEGYVSEGKFNRAHTQLHNALGEMEERSHGGMGPIVHSGPGFGQIAKRVNSHLNALESIGRKQHRAQLHAMSDEAFAAEKARWLTSSAPAHGTIARDVAVVAKQRESSDLEARLNQMPESARPVYRKMYHQMRTSGKTHSEVMHELRPATGRESNLRDELTQHYREMGYRGSELKQVVNDELRKHPPETGAATVRIHGNSDHEKLLAARKAARAKYPVGHPERLKAERAVRQSRKSEAYTGRPAAPKKARTTTTTSPSPRQQAKAELREARAKLSEAAQGRREAMRSAEAGRKAQVDALTQSQKRAYVMYRNAGRPHPEALARATSTSFHAPGEATPKGTLGSIRSIKSAKGITYQAKKPDGTTKTFPSKEEARSWLGAKNPSSSSAMQSRGGPEHQKLLDARKAARAKYPAGHPERLRAERAVRQSRKGAGEEQRFTEKVNAAKQRMGLTPSPSGRHSMASEYERIAAGAVKKTGTTKFAPATIEEVRKDRAAERARIAAKSRPIGTGKKGFVITPELAQKRNLLEVQWRAAKRRQKSAKGPTAMQSAVRSEQQLAQQLAALGAKLVYHGKVARWEFPS